MSLSISERAPTRTGLEVLQELARALAAREPTPDDLFGCVAEHLNGSGFGFERVAMFRDGSGRFDPVPVAQRGFDDLEVLYGQLAPVEEWPLFHRALRDGGAVLARDAQLDGDVPLQVAGALRLRSVVGVPFVAGGRCLGFALADRGGGVFALDADELDVLSTASRFVAVALAGAIDGAEERRVSELKTQFIALASHELRAPIAGIHGVTMTLRERSGELLPDQVDLLQKTLYEQSDRMRRLVDQLLDLSRLEAEAVPIQPRRFGVRARVEELLRQVAPDKLELVALEVAPDLETVADPHAFDRIVGNLVTNAFRYGAPPVRVAAQQLDTHFRLWVEDRGAGVPPEFAPRLFDRFARGRPDAGDGGSGLGLAIAQSFAQAQGGRLLYEDADPTGARFQLVLPARLESAGGVADGGRRRQEMTPEQERAARNERLFREINERVELLNQAAGATSVGEFVCECSDPDCTDPIRVPLDDYAAVRCHENRFLLAPGHEREDVDRVIEPRGGYLVVEKKLAA